MSAAAAGRGVARLQSDNAPPRVVPFGAPEFDPDEALMRMLGESSQWPLKPTEGGGVDIDGLMAISEQVLAKLQATSQETSVAIQRLQDEIAVREDDLQATLAEMADKGNGLVDAVASLEARIGEIDATPVVVGDRLENLHRQIQQLNAAHKLVSAFQAFHEGSIPHPLQKEHRDLAEAAQLCNELNQIADLLGNDPNTKTAVTRIQQFHGELENEILAMFCDALGGADPDHEVMRECATLLQQNFGSASCRQAYVQLHPFFANPADYSDYGNNERLELVLKDIESLLASEKDRIRRIFFDPQPVMDHFIVRVLEARLSEQLQEILEEARKEDDNGSQYLSCISTAYNRMLGAVGTVAAAGYDNSSLEGALESAFQPYKKSFVEWELNSTMAALRRATVRSLGEAPSPLALRGSALLDDFMSSHAHDDRLRLRASIMAQLSAESVAKAAPGGVLQVDLSGLPSEGLVHECAEWLQGAFLRCEQFVIDTPHAVATLSSAFFLNIGDYLYACWQVANEGIGFWCRANPEATTDQLLCFISRLRACVNAIGKFFSDHVEPLIVSEPNLLTPARDEWARLENGLQREVLHALRASVGRVLAATKQILQHQPRSDYYPSKGRLLGSSGELDLNASTHTRACDECCRVLAPHVRLVREGMEGANARAYLSQLAWDFARQLEEHLKKQHVDTDGAFVLRMDLIAFVDALRGWYKQLDKAPLERLERCKELTNLLSFDAKNLKHLIVNTPVLAELPREELTSWLRMRADYSKAHVASVIAEVNQEFQSQIPT